ncbi:MAG: UPF0175 family protein [bacterium]
MKPVSLQVDFPEDVFFTLRKSKRGLEQEVKKIVALELFRQRRLSSGKAAQLAGMCLSDFMDLTREHKIPWVEYTEEELKKEVEEAREIVSHLRGGAEE